MFDRAVGTSSRRDAGATITGGASNLSAEGDGVHATRQEARYGSTRRLRIAKRISSLKLAKFIFFMMLLR